MTCSFENDTFASVSLNEMGNEKIFGVAGRNEIVGTVGKCIDAFLIRKELRKCRIIGSMELGRKLANGSYSGILGMLQRKSIDLYLRGEPDFLHEDFITKTIPIHMEKVVVAHFIPEQNSISFFNLLNNVNVGLTLSASFAASLLVILALSFAINEFASRLESKERRKIEIRKRIVSTLSSFGGLKRIGVFFVFVQLFLWFAQLFLTNNIKTNKVVVDKSQLIKDQHDIFTTPKVACMMSNEQLTNMISSSPAKTILSKIYYEKTRLRPDMIKEREILKRDRCLLERHPKMIHLIGSPFFLVGEREAGNVLLASSFLFEGIFKRIFVNQKNIYEYNLVIYYNGEKPRLGEGTVRYVEHGLTVKMYSCVDQVARESCRLSKIALFENEDDYVSEYSGGFSDLVLENFLAIFQYHFILCSLLFAAFSGHHLIKLAKIVLPSRV